MARDLDTCRIAGKPLVWQHTPNEGRRGAKQGALLKRSGVKAGVSDVLIYTPPPLFPQYRGVAIELKRQDGTASDVSPEQWDWLARLSDLGWIVGVAYGAEDARRMLRAVGYPI